MACGPQPLAAVLPPMALDPRCGTPPSLSTHGIRALLRRTHRGTLSQLLVADAPERVQADPAHGFGTPMQLDLDNAVARDVLTWLRDCG